MMRWHQEKKITCRNWRNHRRIHVNSNIENSARIGRDPYDVDCECDNQIGRFRKKDAYDCGKTMCRICHYNKWLYNGGHEMTRQEIMSALKLKEGIVDFFGEEDENQDEPGELQEAS